MRLDSHQVSVVIPTTGRASVEHCLAALDNQTRPADELVVIEDRQRRGASWSRNQGIQRSRGDLIAFIDDDCMAPPDWLARLVAAIDTYQPAGAGGKIIDTDPLLKAVRARRQFPKTEGIDHQGLVGNSANIIFDRKWLAQCQAADGYVFNEHFGRYGSEDHELVLRIRSRGGCVVFVPNPVEHLRRVTLGHYLKYTFQRGIGVALLHEAHRHYGRYHQQQRSLLWSGTKTSWQRIAEGFYWKVIGPTDANAFPHLKYFVTFWLSQKYQVLGYLAGRLFLVPGLRRHYRSLPQ